MRRAQLTSDRAHGIVCKILSLLGLPMQKPFKSEAPLLLEVFNSIFQDLQPEALLAAKQVCL